MICSKGGNPTPSFTLFFSSLISASVKKIFTWLPFLSCFCNFLHAQQSIYGRVLDKTTLEPLELAVLHDPETGRNFTTDRLGRFAMTDVSGDSVWIEASFIGYRNLRIKIRTGDSHVVIGLEKSALDMKAVLITGHSAAGAFHTLSQIDLNRQPARSAQDLLRLVPGLFIAQHQGGGKAEQIFLRGFDADHGTDVNISVDGMPVNMVSHAHGQGYADLHFLIPETVKGYEFGKGPYYAAKGDFTTAGYVEYSTKNVLDRNMVKLETGEFQTERLLAMINLLGNDAKAKTKGQSAYVAADGLYSNGGPFAVPEHFKRGNLFGKFVTPLDPHDQLTIMLSTMWTYWRASGEIPNRTVAEGYIRNRFGALDSLQGGQTSRTNVILKLSSDLGHHFFLDNEAYYSHYYFNLITNFTFFYADPVHGDEFNQHESRDLGGYNSRLTHRLVLGKAILSSVAGIGTRFDKPDPIWLAHTEKAQFLHYLQLGKIREWNANAWLDETLETGKWTITAGARVDYFYFYYLNMAPFTDTAAAIFDGEPVSRRKAILCPKVNIQYTLNPTLQLYVKTGKGFHSNDARVVIANQGFGILPPAYGIDLGTNWKPLPDLFVNAAVWYLYLQEEFTYGQDYGDESVQPGGRTVRKGIDISARYQISHWLYAFANADLARPRCIDSVIGHKYLALAPTFTGTAGLDFTLAGGLNGGISYRYLHNRSANSTYSLTALGYFITDLAVNYTRKNYEIGLSVQNLFNQAWNESQFQYISRLKYETAPVDQVSYTPGDPLFAKLKLALFF
jgi:hypothetical protein